MNIDIKIPYTTRPSMTKNQGPVCTSISRYYHTEKLKQLAKFANDLWAITPQAVDNHLIKKVSRHLGLPEKDNIVDLALCFDEDLAILHNGILSAICFCFPSSWIPANRIGMTLQEIHKPVADNQHLVEYSDRLSKTISDPVLGSFRRQVWTLTTNPDLSAHPNIEKPQAKSLEDLYFRLETQTTDPLGDGSTSLFFVKVEVLPLEQIWDQYGNRIIASINSMSDSILDYKNLRAIKTLLNQR